MGWRKSGSRSSAYVFTKRVRKKPRNVYVGTGEIAEIAAQTDVVERAETTLRRQTTARLQAAWLAAEQATRNSVAAATILARAAVAADIPSSPLPRCWCNMAHLKIDSTLKELERLNEKAKKNDPDARTQIREILAANPSLRERAADLAGAAEEQWIRLLVGDDATFDESLRQKLAEMKSELAAADDAPMAALAIQNVCASWLQFQYAQQRLLQAEKAPPAFAKFVEQRIAAAAKRHQDALRALNDIRPRRGDGETRKTKGRRTRTDRDANI